MAARGARAAAERMRRVGVLVEPVRGRSGSAGPHRGVPAGAAAKLGWTDGRNVASTIAGRGRCRPRCAAHAAELVALAPDVILASGGLGRWRALLQATRTMPIVFVQVADPVGAGFVDSLARPGGNVTGFTQFEYGIGAKWLELLKEIAPGVDARGRPSRSRPSRRDSASSRAIQAVAPSLGVELQPGRRARRRRDRARRRRRSRARRMAA